MTTPWYDTKEGLEARLKSGIAGLREIARARHTAGYERRERMAEWCLIGRFWTDSCGNFSRFTEGAPHDQRGRIEIPDVMSREQALGISEWITTTFTELPPEDGRCDRCDGVWTMRNVDDFMWKRDRGDLPVARARHKTCNRLAIIEAEADEIRKIVERSEMPFNSIHMIPNEYFPDPDVYGPWFMIETPKGRIKIGWRKRVINIDWSLSGYGAKGEDVVDEANVTYGPQYVHAYGADKAVEALRKIAGA